jgi:hypothetical protein
MISTGIFENYTFHMVASATIAALTGLNVGWHISMYLLHAIIIYSHSYIPSQKIQAFLICSERDFNMQ